MPSPTKEEEIVVFHYRLGVAITQWADVEHQLRDIMNVCFEAKLLNRESLAIGLFSLEGFRAKLNFVEGVVSRKLAGSQHLAEWHQLVKRAREHSQLRNDLAHWGMGKYWHRRPGRRVMLVPWKFQKPKRQTKQPSPPKGSLFTVDIFKHGAMFYALAVSLGNFRARICKQQEPYPKSLERADNRPPSFETILRQMREGLSLQQQSSRERRRLEDEQNAAASLLAPTVTQNPGKEGNDGAAKDTTAAK